LENAVAVSRSGAKGDLWEKIEDFNGGIRETESHKKGTKRRQLKSLETRKRVGGFFPAYALYLLIFFLSRLHCSLLHRRWTCAE